MEEIIEWLNDSAPNKANGQPVRLKGIVLIPVAEALDSRIVDAVEAGRGRPVPTGRSRTSYVKSTNFGFGIKYLVQFAL